MAKINILDSTVYNKISAGEVVEKPSSVVKELVENALDAGATHIEIKVADGGLSLIQVSDNGCGIEYSELKKVFLPHATSKILQADELNNIRSLGFRGEAMASIASVSNVELTSCVKDADGFSLQCLGGEIGEPVACPREVGTTIVVKNLFFNTPARLKFMRKPKTEEHDITQLVEKFTFSNPFICFEYSNEDGIITKTSGEGLLESLAEAYGDDISEKTLEINAEEYGMRLIGFISNSTFSRPTRAYQTFIVNGRLVTNIALVTALNNAYSDYFVKRCYPFAVLCMTVNPTEIDVNVHPAKTEIRFEYQSKVFSFLQRNIRKCLDNSLKSRVVVMGELGGVVSDEWTRHFVPDAPKTLNETTTGVNLSTLPPIGFAYDKEYFSEQPPVKSKPPVTRVPYDESEIKLCRVVEAPETHNLRDESDGENIEDYSISNQSENTLANSAIDTEPHNSTDIMPAEHVTEAPTKPAPAFGQEKMSFGGKANGAEYRVAGQVFGTYIVLEFKDELLLIDQHAACEFTLYARLKKQLDEASPAVQPLMVPYEFSLDCDAEDTLINRISELDSIGIEIKTLGAGRFVLCSLPLLLTTADCATLVADLVSDRAADAGIKDILMYTACHSAIKGNTYLDDESIAIFINSVFKEGINPKCPHGRPAYVKITRKDLEKLFLRIV